MSVLRRKILGPVPLGIGTACLIVAFVAMLGASQKTGSSTSEVSKSADEPNAIEYPDWADTPALRAMYRQVHDDGASAAGESSDSFLAMGRRPADFEARRAEARGWSDDVLDREVAALVERLREEIRWAEFFWWSWSHLEWVGESGLLPETRRKLSALKSAVTALWIDLLTISESESRWSEVGRVDASREEKEAWCASAASWLPEIKRRRRWLSRQILVQMHDVAPDRERLNLFWDPATDKLPSESSRAVDEQDDVAHHNRDDSASGNDGEKP